jgi:AmmeMemoRadiSam system protein A
MPLSLFVNMLPAESSRIGEVLLPIARCAIARKLGRAASANESAPWLAEPHATFVTLGLKGRLRGCIGSIEVERSLLADLKHNALGAAFRDPRFGTLRDDELDATVIEVSLLTPPQTLGALTTEAEVIAQLVPHRDGVILELGNRSATFLPQVWESLPEPRHFLAELKQKAGLAPDYWSRELKVSRYGVQKWSEAEPARARALP